MKSAITIRVDSDLLRKVKLIGAQEGITVDALIEREVNALVKRLTASLMNKPLWYDEARHHALTLLREGWNLGWKRPSSRDELHER